jgi:hypothetical protein
VRAGRSMRGRRSAWFTPIVRPQRGTVDPRDPDKDDGPGARQDMSRAGAVGRVFPY